MNRKDCETIGYILATHLTDPHMNEAFFNLDSRIKPEYEAFEEVMGKDEEVMELHEKMMVEKFGEGWSYLKAAKIENKKIYQDAVKEVAGIELD